ncbi:MAG: S8 family serine peptidase [Thermoleophilia bacterium]|nr:S8 family serine peptidase [Thermoleophilia bacterium]
MGRTLSRLRSLRFVSVALGALVLCGTALTATSASVTIDTVGGQTVSGGKVKNPVSGAVTVAGRAGAIGGGDTSSTEPAAKPLVADAGDSAFVAAGQPATLLGAGYGGAEPYTFSWSTSAGTLAATDAPTAQVNGAPVGTHTATLTIRDSAGATATDTVKFVVYQPTTQRVLDKTQLDPTPGALGLTHFDFPFTVAPDTASIKAVMTHLVATNDYDLKLLDPSGKERAFPGLFVPNTREEATIQNPEPGTWTARVERYATAADEVRVTVDAVLTGGDPRPQVSSGGPYRFALGDKQALDGTVAGGTAPLSVGWDTDGDGVYELSGVDVTANLGEGKHIVTVKATDAKGLERRETTSVLVADAARLAAETTALTVVAIADTGINPYHLEFSAETYPDPDVLRLTNNFTKHPSEYLNGYPKEAKALPVTLGQGYYPERDRPIWTGNTTIEPGKLYWIPGTKIVGAIDSGGSTGATSSDDPHPILDDNGHGSGSASVSAGNRYGYCPTCLLVVTEGLTDGLTAAAQLPWVDLNSNSWGTVGGAPLGLVAGGNRASKTAVERGQTVLFAAGNGVGNAFDVPQASYGSQQVGPDWNVIVGAIRRDNQRAIVGDAIPVHISAWGDGNLPSACRTGTVGQCAFGGTSAATPYTAGVFGTVLTAVRRALGDTAVGQRPGQVIAEGLPIAESEFLADGRLTRAELREAILRTAFPLNQGNAMSPYPYPATAPYLGEANVLFEGWGAATPESAQRAIDVLLGRELMPERPFEESFFALDRGIRDHLYGGYDRDGDGNTDVSPLPSSFVMPNVDLTTVPGVLTALGAAAAAQADLSYENDPAGSNPLAFYLHRVVSAAPGVTGCGATNNELFMDQTNSSGDLEPCFESRITSVPAAYRPIGIFPSKGTLSAPLPAGSRVNVELYITTETPSLVRPTGVLMATDRELGEGRGPLQVVRGSGAAGVACATLGEACWTKYTWSFDTTRPAFTGEQLTFQVQFLGTRSTAFGVEGAHASRISITPGPMPPSGLEFGATIDEPANGSRVTEGEIVAGGRVAFPNLGSDPTGAGGHPTTKRVDVSVDDPSFANPIEANLDTASGTWSAPLGKLALGEHTVYARASMDGTRSEVASSTFTVVENAEVQWQIVSKNSAPKTDAWKLATGLQSWTFGFDTANYASGPNTIVVRLLEAGNETARATASAKFK